jgi:CBS domain-containing protein
MFKNKQGLFNPVTMHVADIMKKKLETIDEGASIQQTAGKMKEKNVSSLIVVDANGRPRGIVTERDLARKVCINNVPANAVTNKEIMSAPLITVMADSSPTAAADLMLQHNVRHLLVVDKNNINNTRPIGMVTPLDFTRYQEFTNDSEDKDAIEKILDYYRE